jgi:hypothetical protein
LCVIRRKKPSSRTADMIRKKAFHSFSFVTPQSHHKFNPVVRPTLIFLEYYWMVGRDSTALFSNTWKFQGKCDTIK